MFIRLKVLNGFRRYANFRLVSTIEISDRIIFIKNIHNLKYFAFLKSTSNILSIFYRSKFTKSNVNSGNQYSDDESESEIEYTEEKDSKIMRIKINSLRADLILKAGLGMARNKVLLNFYKGKIRLNGKNISKKSIQLNNGDEIDIIKCFNDLNPSHLVVSRVQILSAKENDQNIAITLRRYKSLIIDNYEGKNAYKSY